MTENPAVDLPGGSEGSAAVLTSVHVQRALGGNGESLEWLVARLAPLLVAQAAYRLGPKLRPHYEPEDLVNDAWLVALPRLPELQARDGRHTPVLLKFLSTTMLFRARNLLKSHVRKAAAQPDGESSQPDADPIAALRDERSGVVTRALRHERQDEVRRCIDALAPAEREILILRGIEQQPASTVSMLLGLTDQAVSKRYRRALARLRDELPGSVLDELADG